MGRKKTLKLPSLFKTKELAPPTKHHHVPRHFSFRASDHHITKTINNCVSFDPFESKIESFTTESDHIHHEGAWLTQKSNSTLETVIRGVRRSERLFFEPLSASSSILEENKKAKVGVGVIPMPLNLKESVVLVGMESKDPYGDFRRSMEEVVETYGVKDWKGLEELLGWYLRLNGKNNHGFIVLAFVDLLIALAVATTSSDSPSHSFTSYCSAVSSFASSPIVFVEKEIRI